MFASSNNECHFLRPLFHCNMCLLVVPLVESNTFLLAFKVDFFILDKLWIDPSVVALIVFKCTCESRAGGTAGMWVLW